MTGGPDPILRTHEEEPASPTVGPLTGPHQLGNVGAGRQTFRGPETIKRREVLAARSPKQVA